MYVRSEQAFTPTTPDCTGFSFVSGSRLLVSVGNSVHYMYDTLRPNIGPTAAFTGHATSSFFIKACFSPDGAHILSGSSDKNAYIWQVGICTP